MKCEIPRSNASDRRESNPGLVRGINSSHNLSEVSNVEIAERSLQYCEEDQNAPNWVPKD